MLPPPCLSGDATGSRTFYRDITDTAVRPEKGEPPPQIRHTVALPVCLSAPASLPRRSLRPAPTPVSPARHREDKRPYPVPATSDLVIGRPFTANQDRSSHLRSDTGHPLPCSQCRPKRPREDNVRTPQPPAVWGRSPAASGKKLPDAGPPIPP